MFLHVSTEYVLIVLHQGLRFISSAPSFLADLCIKLKNSTILRIGVAINASLEYSHCHTPTYWSGGEARNHRL